MERQVPLGLCPPSPANTVAGPCLGLGQKPDVRRQQNSLDTATYFVCVRASESKANPHGFGIVHMDCAGGASTITGKGAEHHQ